MGVRTGPREAGERGFGVKRAKFSAAPQGDRSAPRLDATSAYNVARATRTGERVTSDGRGHVLVRRSMVAQDGVDAVVFAPFRSFVREDGRVEIVSRNVPVQPKSWQTRTGATVNAADVRRLFEGTMPDIAHVAVVDGPVGPFLVREPVTRTASDGTVRLDAGREWRMSVRQAAQNVARERAKRREVRARARVGSALAGIVARQAVVKAAKTAREMGLAAVDLTEK